MLNHNPDMAAAAEILILGGLLNLVFSFLMGLVLASQRKQGDKTVPIEKLRWLLSSHEVSMLEGFMCISLGFAVQFADLSINASKAAAWLIIVASAFQDCQGIVNHIRGIDDQFKQKSLGWIFGVVQALGALPGVLMIVGGVFRGRT